MKHKGQKKRSVITVSVILSIALLGLVFIQSDFVAADRNSTNAEQTQGDVAESAASDFGQSVSVLPSLIRIFSALVLVIGAIYGGIYLLKRMMGRRYTGAQNRGNLEVLETIHIAQRKTITLLRVGEKSVLIGSTEGSMSLLTELDNVETTKLTQIVETESAPDSFGNFLKVAVDKFKEVTRKRHAAL